MGRNAAFKRGAEPARRVFGPALFDAIPKAVFGRVAYQFARYGTDGDDVGDQVAKRRLLEAWEELAPGLEQVERTPFMPEGIIEAWD